MDFTRRLAAVRRARPARCFLPHTRPKEHPSMARHRPNVVELASRDRPAAHWKPEQPAGSTSLAQISFAFPTVSAGTRIPSHPAGPKTGNAPCRESVWRQVEISGVPDTIKKNKYY